MPAVWITLDYMDGRSKIKGPVYPDEIDLTGLLFRLNERDLATVTFTRANPITAIQKASHEIREHQREHDSQARRPADQDRPDSE